MDNEKDQQNPVELPFDLKDEIGEVKTAQEFIPGVYYLTAQKEGCAVQSFYLVADSAAIYAAVHKYGQHYPEFQLYAVSEDTSGWRIVEYELCKYQIMGSKTRISKETEREVHRIAVFAASYHPEYFGEHPVPFQTPKGYTLRHQKLENGVYWLETSRCEEMLAVCYPIWNTEFTSIARVIGEPLAEDLKKGFDKTFGYLFYSLQTSCVALYELMQTRPSWDGALVDKPALMNAIWKNCPKYAAMAPRLDETEWKHYLSGIKTEREKIIGIYPDAGEDFLLFRRKL